MSFLTRTINASRTAAIATPASRIAVARSSRTFTTSLAAQKTASETVKDELKHIDRVVSDKLVDGINLACMSNIFFPFSSLFLDNTYINLTWANQLEQLPHRIKSKKQPRTSPAAVSPTKSKAKRLTPKAKHRS
jgi:hypothetical protein